mgnify:CR=1 FL=1
MSLVFMFLSETKLPRKLGKEIIKKANELGVNLDNKEFRNDFKGIYVK